MPKLWKIAKILMNILKSISIFNANYAQLKKKSGSPSSGPNLSNDELRPDYNYNQIGMLMCCSLLIFKYTLMCGLHS